MIETPGQEICHRSAWEARRRDVIPLVEFAVLSLKQKSSGFCVYLTRGFTKFYLQNIVTVIE
jgi:hypothetical protein